jgi:hypothetical protein
MFRQWTRNSIDFSLATSLSHRLHLSTALLGDPPTLSGRYLPPWGTKANPESCPSLTNIRDLQHPVAAGCSNMVPKLCIL